MKFISKPILNIVLLSQSLFNDTNNIRFFISFFVLAKLRKQNVRVDKKTFKMLLFMQYTQSFYNLFHISHEVFRYQDAFQKKVLL